VTLADALRALFSGSESRCCPARPDPSSARAVSVRLPRAAGTVMTVEFELDGRPFIALNGGPDFTFA
jgi:hypothetical protein